MKRWTLDELAEALKSISSCPSCGLKKLRVAYKLERYHIVCKNRDCQKYGIYMGNHQTIMGVIQQWNSLASKIEVIE